MLEAAIPIRTPYCPILRLEQNVYIYLIKWLDMGRSRRGTVSAALAIEVESHIQRSGRDQHRSFRFLQHEEWLCY